MAGAEEVNKRIQKKIQETILDGALKAFARKGWTVTLADVAASAKVRQSLVSHYTEEIFSALVEQAIQASSAGLQRIQEMPGTPGERLDSLISAFVESRREQPECYQLIDQVLSSEAAPEDLREMVRRQSQEVQEVLRQLIVEGQATGEVAGGDSDQRVRAILACVDGLTRWAAYDPEHYHEHFPDVEIFLRMLKP